MLRKLQFILMIFCLGIFVFPKQNFNVQFAQNTCCESQKQSSDCCKHSEKKSKSCHHESKKEKDCKDDCTTCKMCSPGFVFSATQSGFKNELSKSFSDSKNQFSYNLNFWSTEIFNIWQPPKLG